MWGYEGTVPGPELRFSQGERIRVEIENLLEDRAGAVVVDLRQSGSRFWCGRPSARILAMVHDGS